MTFLSFNLHKSVLENFVGFSIHIKTNTINGKYKLDYYLPHLSQKIVVISKIEEPLFENLEASLESFREFTL
jgi:hypothetical protein